MSTADWLLYAEGDLKTAKAALEAGVTNNACFHSHQTAEKCLKAVLLGKEQEIPKVHDLLFLLERARTHEPELAQFTEGLRFLNQFYIITRYPDALPTSASGLPTKEDGQRAIEYAESILNFLQSVFGVNK